MIPDKYLTYTEYVQYGGTVSEDAFAALEFKARKRIDYVTDCRVKYMSHVPEAVKRCVVALVAMESTVGDEAQAASPTVTSYSNDGYSETYGHALSAADASKRMTAVIGEYLYGELDDNGVPLLYRGVRG